MRSAPAGDEQGGVMSGLSGSGTPRTGAVVTKTRAGLTSLGLVLPETGESAELIPELGGAVHRIALAPRVHAGAEAMGKEPPVELLDPDPYRELAANPRFRGRILFPFNDRIPTGRYRFRGEEFRLAVNDPASDSAIHGALYRTPMRLAATEPGPGRIRVRLEHRFREDEVEGYPFALSIEAAYTLEPGRFTIEVRAENRGGRAAPAALGWHPYFLAGNRGLSGASLSAAFPSFFEADDRALPVGEPVSIGAGHRFDFSTGRTLESLTLDHAFTAPPDGRLQLRTAYGTLELVYDRSLFAFTQLYIPPDRGSVAVEPVSAAPDAFNHPERGLIVLEPGVVVSGTISVSLFPPE